MLAHGEEQHTVLAHGAGEVERPVDDDVAAVHARVRSRVQALARDVPGGVVREREDPIALPCLDGVVFDFYAQVLEEPLELVLAPRDGARNADAGADPPPRSSRPLGDLSLRTTYVLCLQRARPRADVFSSALSKSESLHSLAMRCRECLSSLGAGS